MYRLFITLVRSKLEYASVVWNSITSTNSNKLERIQQRFSALCFNRFFPEVHCYSLPLEQLKLHTLRMMRHRFNVLFLIQVYLDSKFCPAVLEIVGLRVSLRYITDLTLFSVCSSCKNCPSARCDSVANVVCRDVDVFVTKKVLITIFIRHNTTN
jgi:hypothetical protein